MADIPIIVCTAGKLKGRKIEVPEGGLDIGRSDDSDIKLEDDGVSRFHARLLYDNGQLWLQDSGSRNGIFVNGTRVTDHRALKVGDEIAIAEHVFAVQWREEEVTLTQELPPEVKAAAAKEDKGGSWWWPFS